MSIRQLQEEANSLYFSFQSAERKASAAILEARIRGNHAAADKMAEAKRRASRASREALDEIEMKVLDDATAKTLVEELSQGADAAKAHLKTIQSTAMTLKTLQKMAELAEGLLKIVSRIL